MSCVFVNLIDNAINANLFVLSRCRIKLEEKLKVFFLKYRNGYALLCGCQRSIYYQRYSFNISYCMIFSLKTSTAFHFSSKLSLL